MRFVDIKNDIAFRKIFGNENRKETLLSFLNAILDFEGEQRIVQVNILNPYQLPKLKGGKVTIIDVKATDQKGRTYIIEMQVGDIDGFASRVLYYCSKSYADQIKRADFYRDLRPVIFIGVLDFEHTDNPHFISRHQIRDVETGEQTIKDMEFNFIELPKFNKEAAALTTLTDKWIYFIKNAENLQIIPEDINDEGLLSAYEEASMHAWTQEELNAYDYTFMREEDGRARLDKAVQKAVQKAEKIAEKRGKERGKEERDVELVIKAHLKGRTAQEISDFADIDLQRVIDIIQEYSKTK